MARTTSPLARAFALLAAIAVPPLVGAALGQRELSSYFRFPPPLEIPRDYVHWSWIAAALVVLPFGLIPLSWIGQRTAPRAGNIAPAPSTALPPFARGRSKRFPLWGWL